MTTTRQDLIYLTGFMGSGKSTIAPILANVLGYDVVDLDNEIVKTTGKKIHNIFLEEGEERFRTIERDLLHRMSSRHRCVISLGGGTIANEENFAVVKSTGLLIYLKTENEEIFRRLRKKTDRPLLKNAEGGKLSDTELRERIRHILGNREPFYHQADLIIETMNQRVGITVDAIVRAVSRHIVE